jgi:hypothetical protein
VHRAPVSVIRIMLTQRQDTARARTEKHFGAEPSLKVGLNTEKTSSSPSATSTMAIANVPHNGISTICWKTVPPRPRRLCPRCSPSNSLRKNHQALETVRRPAVVKLQNLPPLLLLRHRTRHGFSADLTESRCPPAAMALLSASRRAMKLCYVTVQRVRGALGEVGRCWFRRFFALSRAQEDDQSSLFSRGQNPENLTI